MGDPTKTLKELGMHVITDEDIAKDLARLDAIKITRAKGGTAERVVDLIDIQIPDAWHIAMWLKDCDSIRTNAIGKTSEHLDYILKKDAELILELWYLTHDLLKHIKNG